MDGTEKYLVRRIQDTYSATVKILPSLPKPKDYRMTSFKILKAFGKL